jgi:hypothetical protein
VIARSTTANLSTISASLTGWGAFSFVEAAVLLVAAAVIVLLFVRAEGAAFHVPGGDGGVITAAGLWACLLIIWRMFDKQGTTGHGLYTTASGIEWGIFIALAVAALLAYTGSRIKLANEPEPPLPGESAPPTARSRDRGGAPVPRSRDRAAAPSRPDRGAGAATSAPDRAAVPPVPDPAPPRRRRVRPSSLSEPEAPHPPRPADQSESDATQVMPGSTAGERRRRSEEPRPHRGLDFSELEQIRFDEPPEAPTVRRRESDPEDPLTARLDRPD